MRWIRLALYYGFAQYLPASSRPVVGKAAKAIRRYLAAPLFKHAGPLINIERRVDFGSGSRIELGDRSSIGMHSRVEAASIADGVMIGPEFLALSRNHSFEDPDVWIGRQGSTESMPIRIDEGSWLGARVTVLPGVHIGRMCVVGACSVVTKDVEDFSVVAGNPARLIRRWGPAASVEPPVAGTETPEPS
jgi:maltose O-acetyltransferase